MNRGAIAYKTSGKYCSQSLYVNIGSQELKERSIETFYHSVSLGVVCCCSGFVYPKACSVCARIELSKLQPWSECKISGWPKIEKILTGSPVMRAAV